MADAPAKSNRGWLLVLLLLLLWWWWSRRRKTAPVLTSAGPVYSAPIPLPTQPNAQDFPVVDPVVANTSMGGGGGFNGYAPGDTSAAALARLAPESIAALNRHAFQSDDPNDRTAGRPLYLTYQDALAAGDTARAEAARRQIAALIDPEYARGSAAAEAMQLAGQAAAAAAASSASALSSSLVHTQVEPPAVSYQTTTVAPYSPPKTTNPAALQFDAGTAQRLDSGDNLYSRYIAAMNGTDNALAEQLSQQVLTRIQRL
jgi:hypothetical protein